MGAYAIEGVLFPSVFTRRGIFVFLFGIVSREVLRVYCGGEGDGVGDAIEGSL